MLSMHKVRGHLKTINQHKAKVTQLCFRCHLYKQGILHDLSKYTWTELKTGFTYFQGFRSPIDAQKEDIGYSLSWLHHKGRNKHHYEYWIDYGTHGAVLEGMKMPVNYVVEMFLDRIAASKVYRGTAYTDRDPLDYFLGGKGQYLMHEETEALLEKLLIMLAKQGEEKTFLYIRQEVLKKGDKKSGCKA